MSDDFADIVQREDPLVPWTPEGIADRAVFFLPGYDFRQVPRGEDPRAGSVHGMEIMFVLRVAPDAAMTFTLYTDWLLNERDSRFGLEPFRSTVAAADVGRTFPMPAGLRLHSSHALPKHSSFEVEERCPFIGTESCHQVGGSSVSYDTARALLTHGHAGVWRDLEEVYAAWMEEDPDA